MHAVMWDGNTDQPGFADVANAVDAKFLAEALVAAGARGVCYWNMDGRTSTSAEMDYALHPDTLEVVMVDRAALARALAPHHMNVSEG